MPDLTRDEQAETLKALERGYFGRLPLTAFAVAAGRASALASAEIERVLGGPKRSIGYADHDWVSLQLARTHLREALALLAPVREALGMKEE